VYNLKAAIGVKTAQEARWLNESIGNMLVHDLFITFRKLYITLTNPFIQGDVYIDLESLRLIASTYQDTFNNFLVDNGSKLLASIPSIPILKPKYAVYSDAFRAGYKVQATNALASTTAALPNSDKSSLKIWRDDPVTDMNIFYKNCLVSVNGFYHNTTSDGTHCIAIDGAKSMRQSRQNQMGFLSFLNIGKIEQVRIKEDMIFKQAVDSDLKTRIYVTLPKDTTNKTVLLVLGGYLLFPDSKSYYQTGDNTFSIDINRMPFVERFFESQKYIDYSDLQLPKNTTNSSLVNLSDLLSDAVLTKFLGMPQTFFVIVDTANLFTNRVNIKTTGMPGMFISYNEPKYPLITGVGRIAEYWKTYEDKQWAINVTDSYLHNRVFNTLPVSDITIATDSDVPARPYINSSAYLLEIGKDF
jgi:hypothetical protein